jgi:hypothetical protein
MSTDAISPLRQRMIEDMSARKLNPHTQRSLRSSMAATYPSMLLAMVRRAIATCRNTI